MTKESRIELLSPARDLACGMAAINHGADAVYIGAPKFGARAAAGNALADIEALCRHARLYGARVHVTMNTILFDAELEDARAQVIALWNAGVDALIVQDMAFLEMDLPPIPLHASTQVDNRTPAKVRFLEESGFGRVILARELSLKEITAISDATIVPLEAFVHGALCVSYSGQCWMSAALGGRSANRGICGQPCRLTWNLKEASGKVLSEERHLLSLKDMDRSAHLAAMIDAGISSFKIEGRLKSVDYVKNVTAFYRQALDRELAKRAGAARASFGTVTHHFTPHLEKSFFRGGTDYFLTGRRGDVASFDTPKAMGERMGIVVNVSRDHFTVKTEKGRTPIVNGDGLCFLDEKKNLKGVKANRVEGGLIRLNVPVYKTGLFKGAVVYRNYDHAFLKLLEKESAERRLALDLHIKEVKDGLWISATDETGRFVTHWFGVDPMPARDKEKARQTLETQLAKLGGTPFYLKKLTLNMSPLFIPVSEINRLRRELVDLLMEEAGTALERESAPVERPVIPFSDTCLDYKANVANALAEQFYTRRGVTTIEPAFELKGRENDLTVMETRHCIREILGLCPGKTKQAESLILENSKGRFTVHFLCGECGMRIER